MVCAQWHTQHAPGLHLSSVETSANPDTWSYSLPASLYLVWRSQGGSAESCRAVFHLSLHCISCEPARGISDVRGGLQQP